MSANHCQSCEAELAADAPLGLCPACLLEQAVRKPNATAEPAETSAQARRFVPPTIDELSARFSQLDILELLGQGGMGAVYKVRQQMLDRVVALKILPPEISRDPTFAERFTREARALAMLTHPNIVTVFEFGESDGLYYLLMEFVDGVDLREAIRSESLAPAAALAVVSQICDALQFAHNEGVVHRDIKPENVLLDKRGRVKIADFGLAKLLGLSPIEVTLTATHQVMGTFHYMAPEQLERPLEVDHRADIYSLGVVFYELLTGELPLGRFKLPSEKRALDVRLDDVVLKTLEREPKQRYQHASEVKTDVDRISTSDLRSPPVAKPPKFGAAVIDELTLKHSILKIPAIGLCVAGAIDTCLLLAVLGVAVYVSDSQTRGFAAPGVMELLIISSGSILGIGRLVGGISMIRRRSHTLSIFGAICAVAPCSLTWMLSVPFGIWALIVLNTPEARREFELATEWREREAFEREEY